METDKIKRLLERYYDGRTSEEEDEKLLQLFMQEELPPDMNADKEFFLQLHNCKHSDGEMPQDLEQRLGKMIDLWDCGVRQRNTRKRNRSIKLRMTAGIAASILILASAGIYMHTAKNNADNTEVNQETYAQAQNAILKFSTTLNKGLEQVEAANKKAENIGKIINKTIDTTIDKEK